MPPTPINDKLFLQACEAPLTFEGKRVEVSVCPLDGAEGCPGTLAVLKGTLELVGRDEQTIAVDIGGEDHGHSVDHRISKVAWDGSTEPPLLHIVTVNTLVIVGPLIE